MESVRYMQKEEKVKIISEKLSISRFVNVIEAKFVGKYN